jgi:hypothetical protein
MFAIPAKSEIQFLSGFFKSKASTPPAEERVTSFFARAKKKVTKKETRCVAPQVLHTASVQWREVFLSLGRNPELTLPPSNTVDASSTRDDEVQDARRDRPLRHLDEHVTAIEAAFQALRA